MSSTKKLTTIAILSAMAMVLNLLIQFPIVPAVSFLSYDPKDIIIVIAGFIYGPMTSFIMSVLCSFLEIVFRGGNLLDVLMNVISTCTFACVAACIYKYKHSKKGAIVGLVLGTVCCTLSMTLWNYIITPIYYQMPRSAVVGMLLPGIVPFNIIKCALNAACAMLIYKPLVNALRNTQFVPQSNTNETLTKDVGIVSAFIIVIAGFIYGPMTSFIMSVLCSFLEIVFRGGNLLDVLMDVMSTCTFACVAACIYKYKHSKKGAIIGLVIGTVCCTLSCTLWNYIVTPIYFQMPRSVVVGMLLPGIVPFNIIKCTLNAACAMLIYKPLVNALRNTQFVPQSNVNEGLTKDVGIVSAFIIVSIVVLILVMKG